MRNVEIIEASWAIHGPDHQPHLGTLLFDPETGMKLTVKIAEQGGLVAVVDLMAGNPSQIPQTIYGIDKDNRPISLFGCTVANMTASAGQRLIEVVSMVAVKGVHVPSWDEVVGDNLSARFSLLDNWIEFSYLEFAAGPPNTITLLEQKPWEFNLPDGTKLLISPTRSITRDPGGTSISEGHRVDFKFAQPFSIKDAAHKYVESFKRFLSFATGRSVFIDTLAIKRHMDREVELLLPNRGTSEADRAARSSSFRAPFRELLPKFQETINSWYAVEDWLGDVLNLYFAATNGSLYLHQEFLFLAQALEVYHRLSPNYGNAVQSKAEFRARKKAIIEAITNEKDWLNEKLAHANEKTLAQRLAEIFASHEAEASLLIPDLEAFGADVRFTRNHYTHYGTEEDQMHKVAQGVELIVLTNRMKTLLEICICQELGIDGAPIKRIVDSASAFKAFSI